MDKNRNGTRKKKQSWLVGGLISRWLLFLLMWFLLRFKVLRETITHIFHIFKKYGTSLVVQWLRLRTPNAGGTGSIPGWGSSTCCAVWPRKKKKNEEQKKNRKQNKKPPAFPEKVGSHITMIINRINFFRLLLCHE